MFFEWDPAKAAANFRKHGIDFDTALKAFDDLEASDKLDPDSDLYGEDRFSLTGMASGILITVIYTERQEGIRIISARKPSKEEYDDYYRQTPQK